MAVGNVDCSVQTMDLLLNSPKMKNPTDKSGMDVSLSVAAGSEFFFFLFSVEIPYMCDSYSVVSVVLTPAFASVVFFPHSVLAVSTSDSDCFAPEMVPALAIVIHPLTQTQLVPLS